MWARQMTAYEVNIRTFERAQRMVALRVSRAYRTISGEVILLLENIVPGHFLSEERVSIYR